MSHRPKIFWLQNALLCGALFGVTALPLRAQDDATATPAPTPTPTAKPKWPSGPSAKLAAELEKDPGPSWLAHYQPEDRYKVAGGVWKYVSTELDTYYHLPDSPLMLRQPANIVIGFPDQATAEEAGYRPDNDVQARLQAAQPRVAGPQGPRPLAKATTMKLSDGQSEVTVPAGWIHVGMPNISKTTFGSYSYDVFLPPGTTLKAIQAAMPKLGKLAKPLRKIIIVTATAPPQINLEEGLNPTDWQHKGAQNSAAGEFLAGMGSQNTGWTQTGDFWKDIDVAPSSWGGVKAMKLIPKKGSKNASLLGNSIVAARGSKAFILLDSTGDAKGARQLRNSFVAR